MLARSDKAITMGVYVQWVAPSDSSLNAFIQVRSISVDACVIVDRSKRQRDKMPELLIEPEVDKATPR